MTICGNTKLTKLLFTRSLSLIIINTTIESCCYRSIIKKNIYKATATIECFGDDDFFPLYKLSRPDVDR